MADERKTSAQAWEEYIAKRGITSTHELIDAFFEGYKAGIIDGVTVKPRKAGEEWDYEPTR